MNEARLDEILSFLPHLIPEGILVAGILIQVIFALIRIQQWAVLRAVAAVCIATAMYLALFTRGVAANDFFTIASWQRGWIFIVDISTVVVLMFRFSRHLRTRGPEFIALLLLMLLGAHLLIFSSNLFMVYLSVEILSLSGYMLVALPVLKSNIESGFKYLVFGGVSSAIMIYGISLYYGAYGTVQVAAQLAGGELLGITSVILITFGLLFKISAAPFHLWVPDVYSGASHPVLAVLAIVPKLAAFAFLTTWVHVIPEGLPVIGGIAILTLLTGNLGALRQQNVRRLMGFSAIAHTGFMCMALIRIDMLQEYLLFYAAIYALMTLGIFHLLNHYYEIYGFDNLGDFAGKGRISRGKTIYMVIWMVALTGIPPTAGFTAKLLLFTGLGQVYGESGDTFVLALIILGILNAVISLAYYIKVPYYMIFRKSELVKTRREKTLSFTNLLGTILVLMVLLLFIQPEWLMSWLNSINFAQ